MLNLRFKKIMCSNATLLMLTFAYPARAGFWEFLEEVGKEKIAQDCRQDMANMEGIKDRLDRQPLDVSWYQTFCPSSSQSKAIESYTRGYLAGSLVSHGTPKVSRSYRCFLSEYDRVFRAKGETKAGTMDELLSFCNQARVVNSLNRPDINYQCDAREVVCEED